MRLHYQRIKVRFWLHLRYRNNKTVTLQICKIRHRVLAVLERMTGSKGDNWPKPTRKSDVERLYEYHVCAKRDNKLNLLTSAHDTGGE